MQRSFEHELEAESELEGEFASEFEMQGEGELEVAFAGELEDESEGEDELGELGEHEHGEQFLGNLVSGLSGLFSEGELEGAAEGEDELGEHEFEHEQGEQFFKGLGRLIKRAAPMLKNIARVAAPIAGKAVGGLFGGPAGAMLGSKLAQMAAQQLRELELGGAHESASEFESELGEHELGEHELTEHEVMHELAEHEAQAEAMAHYAAFTESEHEAEAMAGAAASITISPRDQRALRALVPNLVRGAAILTRILRMRRATRPFVRVVPTIVRRTVRSLQQGAANGRPITRQRAAQALTRQTRRVLSSPRYCGAVMRRNFRAVAQTTRPRTIASNGRRGRSF